MADTLAVGRIGWWRFTNGNLTDQSGNGRDLVCVGTQVNTTDKDGIANNAVDLYNGGYYKTNDVVNPLNNLTEWTFAMWVNVKTYISNEGYVCFRDSGNGLFRDSATQFGIDDNVFSYIENLEWELFIFEKTSLNKLNVYINGVLKTTINGFYTITTIQNNLIIGRRIGFLDNRFPNADFDEISMYSRILTADEKTELYNRGVNYNPDTTPPSFNSVSIDTITYNSANLNVNLNEDGKVYYKILARNSTAPTSSELKNNPTGQANVLANTTSIIPITGLNSNANLDCYVVAEDAVPNLQPTPTKMQFTTPQAPTGDVITSVDKSYKTSINSTSMRFVVKPNTKYTFGLQAIRTTKEGIIATNIIQNEVITTPNKSNFKGVVQATDDANYLYQKTTLRLGQNAIGTNDDGLYVGNTAIEDNPTNYMKFSTTTGTFDLKSTGNIRFTNGISNELFFDSGTTTNSFISMNNGSQQIGKVSGLTGVISGFNGLFVGDKNLNNNQYMYYDGVSLNFEGNYFNKVAYVSSDEEFVGACDTTKEFIGVGSSTLNPYYNKNIEAITLKADIPSINFDSMYYGIADTLVINSNIKKIYGNGFMIASFGKNIKLCNNISIEDIKFYQSGFNSIDYGALYGFNCHIRSCKFIEMNGFVKIEGDGGSLNDCLIDGKYQSSGEVPILQQTNNISNLTIIKTTGSYLNNILQGCNNINNIFFYFSSNYIYRVFTNCKNINNLYYFNINGLNEVIFDLCENISNYNIYTSGYISSPNLDRVSRNFTNGRIRGLNSTNKLNFGYIDRISNTIAEDYYVIGSNCINDMNNSWNTTSSIRTLVADSAIVRYTWTYFNIDLVPQKFKIILHGAITGAAINTEIVVTEALTILIIELEMYDDGGTMKIRPISNANTGDEVFVKFTATQLGIRNDINEIGRVVIISETF